MKMPRKPKVPDKDPIGTDARASRRRRKAKGAVCTSCGESNEDALVLNQAPILCFRCTAMQDGRSTRDRHHVAGRKNSSLKDSFDVNDHRILSAYQQEWPEATLKNPAGSPILAVAGFLRGIIDWLRLIIERYLGWIPEWLEKLDAWLTEVLGPTYWESLPPDMQIPGGPEM
jgi:hypothetical protein